MELQCSRCGIAQEQRPLSKCSICFKLFCADCGISKSGRKFCSEACGITFFHGVGDGDEDDEGEDS